MATLLLVETATTNCSVALSVKGKCTALKEDNPHNTKGKTFSHAEKLHGYIETLLNETNTHPNTIGAIAVSKGPGSYTGLRIGVSAVKGLCFAWEKPLIAVSTLSVLAQRAGAKTMAVPLLDARRMEVYSAVFSTKKEQLCSTGAQVLNENSFNEYLQKGKVTFIGDGVEKFKPLCKHPNAVFMPNALPSAKYMAPLAEAKFNKKDFEDVAYFEPYYLKDFKTG
ncbi:MAG: tRNA (adenosine(37)-N6)-threonylcarbamoyltransferase complex dimerization subunit type 1 TsaB [Marinirhabdus sp.]